LAPLLPKLRGQFAEFLNHSSPDRLGILYLTTCVGLGYGPPRHSLEAFLGSIGSSTSAIRLGIGSQTYDRRIYLPVALHPYPGSTIARVGLPSCVTPSLAYYQSGSRDRAGSPEGSPAQRRLASLDSALARRSGYGNINPLSIDYACRPRLRSRLTQSGLAWLWNPWSSGGGVSHSSFATHACILTRVASTARSPGRFIRHTTLPYPSTHLDPQSGPGYRCECHGFGGVLEPRYIVGAESLDQ
jgi:hypothetical protein